MAQLLRYHGHQEAATVISLNVNGKDQKIDVAVNGCLPICNTYHASVLLGNGNGTFQAAKNKATTSELRHMRRELASMERTPGRIKP